MSYFKVMLEPKSGRAMSELWIPIKASTKDQAVEKVQIKCLHTDFTASTEHIIEISQFEYWDLLSNLMNM